MCVNNCGKVQDIQIIQKIIGYKVLKMVESDVTYVKKHVYVGSLKAHESKMHNITNKKNSKKFLNRKLPTQIS